MDQRPADVFESATPTSIELSSEAAEQIPKDSRQEFPQQSSFVDQESASVFDPATATSIEPSLEAAEQTSDDSLQEFPQQSSSMNQRPADIFEPAKLMSIELPTEVTESTSDKHRQISPRYLSPSGSEEHATPPASETATEPQAYTRVDPARKSEANETLMRLLQSSTPDASGVSGKRIEELSKASEGTEQVDQGGSSTSVRLSSPAQSRPSSPTPHSAPRPPLSTTCSHRSLKPSPARATTEVSNADPINWTPSPSNQQPSPLSRTYSALADRYQLHSSSTSLRDRYRAESLAHSRPPSPTPSESVSVSGPSAYQSLQSSQYGLRRSRKRESQQKRDREQRIKRVKVVVSLDGGTDLVVDASVKLNRDGERHGEGWKVKESVRRWEDSNGDDDDDELLVR